MAKLTSSRYAQVLLLLAVVAVLPLLFPSSFYLRVAALVWISALAAIGLNILVGYAGQVSLGQAGFLGIGAYAVAVGPAHLGLHPLVAMVAGAALAGVIAYIVGKPILRLRGYYLAIATLGFGLLVALVLTSEGAWTGGPDGMSVARPVLFGWRISGAETWYWISGLFMVAGAFLALNLLDSPGGRSLRALHDSEVAAMSLGVDVATKKLAAFVLAAVYAAVAGSLLALMNGFITPDAAGFLHSIEIITMVVIGGMGSVLGCVVGAAFLVMLPQTLTFLHDYEHAVLGLLIMVFMVLLPRGSVPSIAARLRRAAA